MTPSSIVSGHSQLGSDVFDTSATTNDPPHLICFQVSEARKWLAHPLARLTQRCRQPLVRRQKEVGASPGCDVRSVSHQTSSMRPRRSSRRSCSKLIASNSRKRLGRDAEEHQYRHRRPSDPMHAMQDKGFVCTKTHAPPSRRYPRPSRSGKRIEQARILHGASLGEGVQTPIIY